MNKKYIITNILCGGLGHRIGGNKPLYLYNNKPLIEHAISRLFAQCDEIILSLDSVNNPIIPHLKKYNFQLVFDEKQNLGPMSGILAGMEYSQRKMVIENRDIIHISAPCDMPLLPDNYVQRLIDDNEKYPKFYKGKRDYPLCANFPIHYIGALKTKLEANPNGLGAYRFLDEIGATPVEIENEDDFININSPINS